jgi:gliding motility-associated-like protein
VLQKAAPPGIMKKAVWHSTISSGLPVLFIMISSCLCAQPTCTDNYFVTRFTTATVKHNYSSVSTPQNEIMIAGYVLTNNTLNRSGWLTKLSAQGTVLWSKQYNFGFYSSTDFRKVINAGNDNFLMGGITGDRDTIHDAYKFYIPYLMKLDKYGNTIWGKYFDKPLYGGLEINNLLRLADGNYAILMSNGIANIITKIDDAGNVKWSCNLINKNLFYFPNFGSNLHRHFDAVMPVAITQLRNGDLAIAKPVSYFDFANPAFGIPKKGFDLMVLKSTTGDTVWRKSYLYRDSLGNFKRPYSDVKNITELPSGDISFIASQGDSAYRLAPFTNQCLNFTASSTGELKSVVSYKPDKPVMYCTDAAAHPDGSRVLLMDNGFSPHLLRINAAGTLQWAKAYNPGLSHGTTTLVSNSNGNYLFSSIQNGANKDLTMIKADTDGTAACIETPVIFTATDITASFFEGFPIQKVDKTLGDFFAAPPGTNTVSSYVITGTTLCRKTCCSDTTGPLKIIDLCNASSYTLPDNYIVKEDGTYPIVLKTSKGCDSIVFYKVIFSKPPDVYLGFDKCFDGKDTLILQTAGGYDSYNWQGTTGSNASYLVTQTGKYWVSVTNSCGTRADTIQVFDECEFEIYMPNAFTPNGDFLNDNFGVPPANKNRLIRLTVYNRWGQKVFETTNPGKRWDGTLQNMQQEPGVYIYYLDMETLNGKKRTKKGTVLLIR